jgi:hypothetical protein
MGVRTAVRHGAGDCLRAYREREGRTLIQQAKLWGIPNHTGLMRYEQGSPIPDRVAVLMVRDTGLALQFLRPELADPNGGGFVFVHAEQLDGVGR